MRADAEAALDRNVRSQGDKVSAAALELQELQASLTGVGEARPRQSVLCCGGRSLPTQAYQGACIAPQTLTGSQGPRRRPGRRRSG